MFDKKKFVISTILMMLCGAAAALPMMAQEKAAAAKPATVKPEKAAKQEKPKKPEKVEKVDLKNLNAEQVAEYAIVIYAQGQRANLAAVRRTELERGVLIRFSTDGSGTAEKSTFERRVTRGETISKDRIRLDQKLSAAQYALIYDANKIFGIINNTVFVPREEAERSFQASIYHNLDTLLRYRENGSTLKLVGKDKQMNVEYYQIDVTDKENRVTRFNISAKYFRVQSIEYSFAPTATAAPVKYVRRFYDYRTAQGTSVPWRTVLSVENKPIEEINISTITYGMKIDDSTFQSGE